MTTPEPIPRGNPSKADLEELRRRAWDLRVRGWSLQQIADELGYSVSRAGELVSQARASIPTTDRADLVKIVEDRYDELLRSFTQLARDGDPEAGRLVLEIEKARRALIGLDAATKIEHTGKIATYDITGVDTGDLT